MIVRDILVINLLIFQNICLFFLELSWELTTKTVISDPCSDSILLAAIRSQSHLTASNRSHHRPFPATSSHLQPSLLCLTSGCVDSALRGLRLWQKLISCQHLRSNTGTDSHDWRIVIENLTELAFKWLKSSGTTGFGNAIHQYKGIYSQPFKILCRSLPGFSWSFLLEFCCKASFYWYWNEMWDAMLRKVSELVYKERSACRTKISRSWSWSWSWRWE